MFFTLFSRELKEAYETALQSYDSSETIKYLHPECIELQFGSADKYHFMMQKSFDAIRTDGGIIATSKGDVLIKDGVAFVPSTIETQKASQQGILELKMKDGQWLITRLP